MKREKPEGKMDIEEFRRLLRSLPDDAFDGHTEFHRLTAEQRLMWLSQAAQFYFECGGKAKDDGSHGDAEGAEKRIRAGYDD